MAKNMLIMHENTPVLAVNFDEAIYDVLCKDKLPFTLRFKLRKVPTFEEIKSQYDLTQARIITEKNKDAIIDWLGNRTLSLSRKNAKWIYNLLRIEQLHSNTEKAKIAIICRAVSVLDNYWLKLEGDTATWESINVRHVPLNETIAQVALHGKSVTLQGSLCTPELTTNGAYAKAWRRHDDGLWLYKLGNNGNTESRIEVMCSNLLDKMNVQHCHYEAGEDDGKYVCMCPSMTTDKISILSGMDFNSYCNMNGLDPGMEMLKIDAESIYKMWIVDYLFSNRDRHGQNWGMWYDPKDMTFICCHPLFDHNNAFDVEWMQDRNAKYQFGDMTVREAAHRAMTKVDFHFTQDITREDFITERQYNEFMWRAKDLGIEILCTYEDRVRTMMSQLHVNLPLKSVMISLPSTELSDEDLKASLLFIRDNYS